jgi:hypothetical protein
MSLPAKRPGGPRQLCSRAERLWTAVRQLPICIKISIALWCPFMHPRGMEHLDFDESWSILRALLPEDLDGIARHTGLIQRLRGFRSAESLTRLLLMHGAGLSLEQTALRAHEHGMGRTTAPALHGRLRSSGEYFRTLCQRLQAKMQQRVGASRWPEGWRYRAIDATEVSEPGPTGSTWRVHYSLRLPELVCDHFDLTTAGEGETLRRWKLEADEVVLADRAYSHRQAIGELIGQGAHFVVRLNTGLFPLEDRGGRALGLPGLLRGLKIGQPRSWDVWFRHGGRRYGLRLCVVRKSAQAAQISRRKAQRRAQRDGSNIRPETLAAADYVLALTNLPESAWPAGLVLDLYRCRWQVELAFKRLKTLLELGHLPKRDPCTAQAWMHLKLLLALMIEQLLYDAEFLSPWGYDLRSAESLAGVQGSR